MDMVVISIDQINCEVSPLDRRILYHITVQILIIIISFFTYVLVDGLLLESEWQQVSSSIQDLSQYFGRSQ